MGVVEVIFVRGNVEGVFCLVLSPSWVEPSWDCPLSRSFSSLPFLIRLPESNADDGCQSENSYTNIKKYISVSVPL